MSKPSESDISQTIAFIRRRFNNQDINLPVNKPVFQGYTESIRILAEGIIDYSLVDTSNLESDQARAIAILSCDYLRGEESQKVLINVPLKRG